MKSGNVPFIMLIKPRERIDKMKKLSAIILIIVSTLCLLTLPASAKGKNFPAGSGIRAAVRSGESQEKQNETGDLSITIDEETNLFIQTIDGLQTGKDPASGQKYDEIHGTVISQEDGGTSVKLPADNVYLVWLSEKNSDSEPAYDVNIKSGCWNAELIELFPAANNPTLVINPPQQFIDEDNFAFEKLTIIAQPDAFPAIKFTTETPAGKCTISIDPTFSIFTAKEAIMGSQAELVLTVFPDFDQVSVWVSGLDLDEDYEESKFMLNTHLTCSNDEKTVTAKSLADNMPALNENGIISFNFDELLKGSAAFFSGDLDGNDTYESVSGWHYFEIE